MSQGEFLINDKVFSKPAVASRVLKEFRELAVYGQEAQPIFAPLSPREVEILDNIAQGMTNKQVAYALSISEQTVKNHMSSILRKLAVNDRAGGRLRDATGLDQDARDVPYAEFHAESRSLAAAKSDTVAVATTDAPSGRHLRRRVRRAPRAGSCRGVAEAEEIELLINQARTEAARHETRRQAANEKLLMAAERLSSAPAARRADRARQPARDDRAQGRPHGGPDRPPRGQAPVGDPPVRGDEAHAEWAHAIAGTPPGHATPPRRAMRPRTGCHST